MSKKYIFIDLDGTLCAFYDKTGNARFTYDAFIEKLPIYSIIYQIKEMFGNENLIIFSATPNDEVTKAKRDWVSKYVKPILNIQEEIYIPWPQTDKIDFLKDLLLKRDILGDECILIDDEIKYIDRGKTELGIKTIHPSYLIALYENDITKIIIPNIDLGNGLFDMLEDLAFTGKYDSIIAKSIRS